MDFVIKTILWDLYYLLEFIFVLNMQPCGYLLLFLISLKYISHNFTSIIELYNRRIVEENNKM